jgi:hypothetical protein
VTISYSSNGLSNAGSTSVNVRWPDVLASGDLVLTFFVNKYPPNGPNTPTGMTLLTQQTVGDGASPAADVGDVYATVFHAISDGTEDGTSETVGVPSGNSTLTRSFSYARTAGSGWTVNTAYGSQGAKADSWSITTGSLDLAAGDVVVVFIAKNSDLDMTHSSHALSATGITFGSYVNRGAPLSTTQGQDCAYEVGEFPVTAGSATGAVTFTMSLSGGGQSSGGVVLVRLRETGAGSTPIGFSGTIPTLTGEEGTSFSQSLTSYFSGSETPFGYSISGTLPAGLSHSGGTISGTPTVGAKHGPFTITGTDTNSDTATSNSFYISLSSNPSADVGYYTVAQTLNSAMEHTTASHSFYHDGDWWQLLRSGSNWNLYKESGNVPGSAGSTVDWVASPHLSSVVGSGQCSVALDGVNNKAYVIGFSSGVCALRVLTYSAGSWTVTTSVNLTGTAGVGFGTSSVFHANEKLSIGVDTNGVPYVVAGNIGGSGAASNGVWFGWPDSAASLGGTWSSVNIDSNAGTPEADASGRWAGIVSQGGTDYHVISYSDNTNDIIRMAWHAVETTLSNYSTGWTTATIDSTISSVDNHVWAGVMNYGGDQVVITLTKAGDTTPAGRLYCITSKLGASMSWTHKVHQVTNGPTDAGALEESPSRPEGILDQINGDVYVVYHKQDSHPYGWIGYKKAALADLLAASSETAVFDVSVARNAHVLINDESLNAAWNAKTPSHPITSGMGYAPVTSAVAASSSAGDAIWWARVALASGGITGTGAITLGDVTSAATGSLALSGAAAIALGNVTSAGIGTLSIAGTAGITLGNVTLASAGSVQNRGALAATLGNITLAATGGSTNTGQAAITLGDVTTSSAASLSLNAQAGGTLGAVTLAATGSVLVSGAVATTLGNVALAATGVLGNTVTGSAAITLGNVTAASTGSVALSGAVGATLGNVTLSATGKVSLAGSAAIALGNVTSVATGSVAIRGAMLATLGNVTLAATGGLEVPTVDGPAGYGYPPMRRVITRSRNNDYLFRPRMPNTRR